MTPKQQLAYIKARCTITASGCWLWEGNTFSNGYGRFSAIHRHEAGLVGRVHVVVYHIKRGSLPKGKPFVCHHCDTKHCCAPKCLWPGSNSENQLDAVRKGVFERYWTVEKRAEFSEKFVGENNPMHGRTGKSAPAYGRVGSKHPMFGKHHKLESRLQTSLSCRATFAKKRKASL